LSFQYKKPKPVCKAANTFDKHSTRHPDMDCDSWSHHNPRLFRSIPHRTSITTDKSSSSSLKHSVSSWSRRFPELYKFECWKRTERSSMNPPIDSCRSPGTGPRSLTEAALAYNLCIFSRISSQLQRLREQKTGFEAFAWGTYRVLKLRK